MSTNDGRFSCPAVAAGVRVAPQLLLLAFLLAITSGFHPSHVRGQDTRPLRIQEELRIGEVTGAPEEQFGDVGYFASGAEGDVFVYDREATTILRFNREGEFLNRVGRRGQGPGEFQRVLGVYLTNANALMVWDQGNNRVSEFRPDGTLVREIRGPSAPIDAARSFAVDRAGRLYVQIILVPSDATGRNFRPAGRGYLRMTQDGHILDTVPVPADQRGEGTISIGGFEGPQGGFHHAVVHALTPEGLFAIGDNSGYEIVLPRADGSARSITRSFEPARLVQAERDQWIGFSRGLGRDDSFPSTKPPFKDLFFDSTGRLWVQRYVEAEDLGPMWDPSSNPARELRWRERAVYDLFDLEAAYQGTVSFPPRSEFLWAAGEVVWALERGELDEMILVRYRVVGG